MKNSKKAAGLCCKLLTFILCITAICGGPITAADSNPPSVIVGNNRQTVSLDGEWSYYKQSYDVWSVPETLPQDLAFSETISLPSYLVSAGQNERIWYRNTFDLVNAPTEAVTLDFGSERSEMTVYVNNAKAGINIAPLLHAGRNEIVLLKPADTDQKITDTVKMVFSSAPVITSAACTPNVNDKTAAFEVSLFNPRFNDVTMDVTVRIRDKEDIVRGTYTLNNVSVLSGSTTKTTITGVAIENFAETQIWTPSNPYLFTAEVITSGDRYQMPVAMRDDAMPGASGYQYGTDLLVPDFLSQENNNGYAWNADWVKSLFKLFKDINWTVITYRDGQLPAIWHEIALNEGILLIDKNEDAAWASSQDAIWTQNTDFLAKISELKAGNADAAILPVLQNKLLSGLFSETPSFQDLSITRLKTLFTNRPVNTDTPSDNTAPKENPFISFFRNVGIYFKNMFEKTFIKDNRYKLFLRGLGNTLLVALSATFFGVIIGMLVAIIKVWNHQNALSKKKNPVLRILYGIAEVYTTIIRGTPVVVQLLITYNVIFVFSDKAVLIGIFAFSVNSGAYVSEIIRAGINSVDKGQAEAGRSLGLSQVTTMKSIVMPQAFKNILPALGNEFISLLKETSVIGYLGVIDLTRAGELVRSRTADAFFTLLFVACIYLILVFGLSAIFKRFERRLNKSDRN